MCLAEAKKTTRLTQHFFFFTKRKPVLKEKRIGSFGKAFLSKKMFLVEICVILWLAKHVQKFLLLSQSLRQELLELNYEEYRKRD